MKNDFFLSTKLTKTMSDSDLCAPEMPEDKQQISDAILLAYEITIKMISSVGSQKFEDASTDEIKEKLGFVSQVLSQTSRKLEKMLLVEELKVADDLESNFEKIGFDTQAAKRIARLTEDVLQ